MKKIGLLGGMSWESTALYYSVLNELVRERLGGHHSARCVVSSVDFAPVEEMQRAGDWPAAASLLAREARLLERAGADLLLLCTNTMHKVAPAIEDAITIPFLHLADVSARAVLDAGLSSVAFLGTGFSMSEPFHTDRIAGHGVEVTVPDPTGQRVVHDIIYDELVRGVVREESRAAYRQVIGRLVDDGAQGVILGCTEIELLIGPADCPVPLFPTTRLHAQAAVDLAFDEG